MLSKQVILGLTERLTRRAAQCAGQLAQRGLAATEGEFIHVLPILPGRTTDAMSDTTHSRRMRTIHCAAATTSKETAERPPNIEELPIGALSAAPELRRRLEGDPTQRQRAGLKISDSQDFQILRFSDSQISRFSDFEILRF